LKIAGKIYVATYDVEDGCVQVTHKGRRSIWTEIGGARAEAVAKMLLKDLLGVLLATVYFAALGEDAGAVWASPTEMPAPRPYPLMWGCRRRPPIFASTLCGCCATFELIERRENRRLRLVAPEEVHRVECAGVDFLECLQHSKRPGQGSCA